MTRPEPPISKELVDWLDSLFPDKAPEIGTPIDKVWYEAGAVKVIRLLKLKREEQSQSVLAPRT